MSKALSSKLSCIQTDFVYTENNLCDYLFQNPSKTRSTNRGKNLLLGEQILSVVTQLRK